MGGCWWVVIRIYNLFILFVTLLSVCTLSSLHVIYNFYVIYINLWLKHFFYLSIHIDWFYLCTGFPLASSSWGSFALLACVKERIRTSFPNSIQFINLPVPRNSAIHVTFRSRVEMKMNENFRFSYVWMNECLHRIRNPELTTWWLVVWFF